MKDQAKDLLVCVGSANPLLCAQLPLSHEAAVLHDVRNMLCLLRQRTVDCGDQRLSAAERAVALEALQVMVDGVCEVSTAQPGEVGQTDLSRLVSEAQPMLQGLLSPAVQLSVKVPSSPVLARGTSVALKRLLVELCANARSAMKSEGQILIELKAPEAMERVALWPSSICAGRYARVIVSDSGAGMTPEVLKFAFEPGRSTNSSISGQRGHGLAVVRAVLEGLGGGIHVSSESGAGTTLELFVPTRQEHVARETKSSVGDIGRSSDRSSVLGGDMEPVRVCLIGDGEDIKSVCALLESNEPRLAIEVVRSVKELAEQDADFAADCVVSFIGPFDDAWKLVRRGQEPSASHSMIMLYAANTADQVLALGSHGSLQALAWPSPIGGLLDLVLESAERRKVLLEIRRQISEIQHCLAPLTPRVREVLQLLRRGLSSKQVSKQLFLSKRTVDDHRTAMVKSTGYGSLAELVYHVGMLETLQEREHLMTHQSLKCAQARGAGEDLGCTSAKVVNTTGPMLVVDPSSAHSFQEFGRKLQELESSCDVACALDKDLRIVWVNSAWTELVRAAGRGEMDPYGMGGSWLQAISPPLREWYEDRMQRCIETGEPWTHEYQCPTAEAQRTMLLSVRPGSRGMLLLQNSVLARQGHDGLVRATSELEQGSRDVGGSIQQCMNCRCTRLHGQGRWAMVADWITEVPVNTAQRLCPSCEHAYSVVAEA